MVGFCLVGWFISVSSCYIKIRLNKFMAEYHFWKEKRRTKKCLKDPNNSKSSKGSNGSDIGKIANHQNNCKNLNLCGVST